jgi:hypothetical protein
MWVHGSSGGAPAYHLQSLVFNAQYHKIHLLERTCTYNTHTNTKKSETKTQPLCILDTL